MLKRLNDVSEFKKKNDFTLDKERNPVIVETAGFIPLEVKFKRFEQNGIRAQFLADEFTSDDYRSMYLSPDLSINLGDDLEDVQMKFELQEKRRQEILNSKLGNFSEERSYEDKLPSSESNPQKESFKENEKVIETD